MKKQTAIFFYVLSAYVVLQFLWWGYHLIELSTELAENENHSSKRVLMIIGEGSVFFLLLLLGLWKIRSSIQKDIAISRRQSNFLLSVTHELKTPLSSNKLYLQTLLKRTSLNEEERGKLLKKAIEENVRLEGMIENILTATRIENHKLELIKDEIQLDEFIGKVVKRWSQQRIPVTLNLEKGIVVNADSFIIESSLLNLLENAHKYAGKEAEIEVYLTTENESIVFGVKDTGPGVSDSFKGAIFEKFTRIGNEETRKEKGTGLGLYIVSELLNFHDARIICLDNNPTGANFKITLTNER